MRDRSRRALGPVLALALALPALGVLPGRAAAAGCPAPGGTAIPVARASGDVVLHGGGWGHGLGMSQYGAEGAARLGCSAAQILTTYYAGTQVVSRPMPAAVRVRMLDNGYRVDVEAVQGALTWVLPGCVPPAPPTPAPTTPAPTTTASPTTTAAPAPATSTPPPTAPGPTPTPAGPVCPPVQPQGARWQLKLDDATHSRFVLWDLAASPRRLLWQGGSAAVPLQLRESGSVAHLTTWRGSSIYLERWVRWDWTKFTVDAALIDGVQQIETTDNGSAMDKYLWGIAEVPASFPPAALQAQAVAARTYAAKRADRVLVPTPTDQNWMGWKKETEGTGGAWGLRWKAAVDATSGQVVVSAATGTMIDALYSSSMGGHTEDERYVWRVDAPFLRPVDDSTWDAASSNPADKRSWAVGLTWSGLAGRLGFSSISTVTVPPRGADARTAGVKVVGIRAGTLVTTYVDGWDLRQRLGLLSPGVTISMRRTGGPAAQPLVGDWDGDGRDQVGWYRDGQVALMMSSGGVTWVKRFRYGRAGDVAVVGDWNGDGRDDLGVFRAGSWLLRSGLNGGSPTTTFRFGRAGDVPVVGSWTGKRVGVGVVRGRTWRLRRSLTAGPAQNTFRFGNVGDVPVVGSWDGAKGTEIGVERDGQWLLRTSRSAGPPTLTVPYGLATDRAVVGDWDGDGRSTLAVVRGQQFLLRATLDPTATARPVTFLG